MTSAPAPRARWSDRLPLETLVPLFAAYFALAVLYAWQAWRRETPTIFTDEIEITQISRAIADTGHPARRGESYQFTSLVPYLTAPGWWIGNTATAYDAIKYFQGLAMAASLFPTYALARFVVSRPWAIFAAVATIAAPALSYAPILVEEPLAYPAAALALYLLVRAVASPSRLSLVLALAGTLVAAATRSQLVTLVGAFGLALVALGWRTERVRRWRGAWDRWDWMGAVLLGFGAVLAFSSLMSSSSEEWRTATELLKQRMLDHGVWAAGALAIGVGILPLVATLAVLVRPRSHWRDPGLRAYGIVTASSLIALCWYAAVKGAYLSTVLGGLVLERNLIYLTPLLFTGTALLLSRRDAAWWGFIPAGAIVFYLVASTPTEIDHYPYYEAHGLSILALANREFSWTAVRIETVLSVLVVASTLLLVAVRLLGRVSTQAARATAVALAALVLGWNLTNEIYAASGEHDFSARMARNLTEPYDWVDRATDGGSVVIVGQQITDPTGLWLTEFWNRSVKKVWSVDPAAPAPGPGPTLTPDLARRDGTLAPSPGTGFALALNGIALQAPVVRKVGTTTLYRLDGAPLQLAYSQSGVSPDAGWTGRNAAYNRFRPEASPPESARVGLSRSAFCSSAPIPGGVLVRIGTLVIGKDRQPQIGKVTARRLVRVRPCPEGAQSLLLRAPRGPWRVEVTSDTFVPAEVDARSSDRRTLGVQVSFGFQPL